MAKIFRKAKMLIRATRENKAHLIGSAELAVMDELDGQSAQPDFWKQTVYGDDTAWFCTTKDGRQISVHPDDCDDIPD